MTNPTEPIELNEDILLDLYRGPKLAPLEDFMPALEEER